MTGQGLSTDRRTNLPTCAKQYTPSSSKGINYIHIVFKYTCILPYYRIVSYRVLCCLNITPIYLIELPRNKGHTWTYPWRYLWKSYMNIPYEDTYEGPMKAIHERTYDHLSALLCERGIFFPSPHRKIVHNFKIFVLYFKKDVFCICLFSVPGY